MGAFPTVKHEESPLQEIRRSNPSRMGISEWRRQLLAA